MSDVWQKYVNDPRTICKYGIKCYQKSSDHTMKFKHPPQCIKRKHGEHHQSIKRIKIPTQDDFHQQFDPIKQAHDSRSQTTEENIPSCSNSSKHDLVELPKEITYYNKTTAKTLIKELFLFNMPSDFYKFYECLQTEQCLEKTLASVNLELIGPYDLFLGKLPVVNTDLYLVHWRFFYDPPEFQNEKKKSPFASTPCQKFMDKIIKWAEDNKFSLEEYSMKKRQSQVVTKTFHGAGIVVPFDTKTQVGYRKLVESDAAIKKLFTQLCSATTQPEKDKILSELQPVITYANIAVDECDFGTGLEIGINLFCSGLKELEPSALSSLCSAYTLLKREEFVKIIQAHLKYRRYGPDMSLLSLNQT